MKLLVMAAYVLNSSLTLPRPRFFCLCVVFSPYFNQVPNTIRPRSQEGDDCSKGAWRGERVCGHQKEFVRMATAKRQCSERGLDICCILSFAKRSRALLLFISLP